MADSSTSRLADEAQDPGEGNSEAVQNALQGTKKQEAKQGKAALVTPELMREEMVQSAVSFLKHPKVVASSDVQRRSFLEKKGLTVDEIDEAFLRLLSLSSNSTSSNTCTSQGVSDHSCRITQEGTEIGTKCVDGLGTPEPETEPVTVVAPRHPKSYMEIMEMIQKGERPDDIQDINDDPPNPDQPISESRMAPKPKPWEKQAQESSSWDLKSQSSNSRESRLEDQNDSPTKLLDQTTAPIRVTQLLPETVAGSETPTDDAFSPKQ